MGLRVGFAASFGFGWMAIAGFHHASSASNYCTIMVQSGLGLYVGLRGVLRGPKPGHRLQILSPIASNLTSTSLTYCGSPISYQHYSLRAFI